VAPEPRLEDFATDPDLLVHRVDLERQELVFAQVSRDTYRESAFLDARMVPVRGDKLRIPLTALLTARDGGGSQTAIPPGFIFHTSFCCSTLLARSLQRPGTSHVLREPWAFSQMCKVKQALTATGRWETEGHALLDLVLRLLSKTYDAGERPVIKPANLANEIAADALSLRPEARAVLLYSQLDDFLVSSLKMDAETRSKLSRFAATAAGFSGYFERFPGLDATAWTPLQSAVVLWHAQLLHLGHLTSTHGARLRTLDAAALLEEPRATLVDVARFLGFDAKAEMLADCVEGPVWKQHSKHGGAGYDPAARQDEFRALHRRHADDIAACLRWAEPMFEHSPPLPFPGTGISDTTAGSRKGEDA
jgi:hypothetical protein